jgi:hypothetical protein
LQLRNYFAEQYLQSSESLIAISLRPVRTSAPLGSDFLFLDLNRNAGKVVRVFFAQLVSVNGYEMVGMFDVGVVVCWMEGQRNMSRWHNV